MQAQGTLGRLVIDQNFFFGDELLHADAAGVVEVCGEELIEALAVVFGWDGEIHRFGSMIRLFECGWENPHPVAAKTAATRVGHPRGFDTLRSGRVSGLRLG